MNCKNCNTPLRSDAKICDRCHKEVEVEKEVGEVEFFSVSTTKLVLLSTATLGLYEIYWFYKNFKAIKEADNGNISVLGRSIFSIFYCNTLFEKVFALAKKNNYPASYSSGMISALYVVLLLIGRVWGKLENVDPVLALILFVVAYLTPIPLVIVQKAVNFNNSKIKGQPVHNTKFTVWEILIVIVGGIFVVLSFLGYLLSALGVAS